jgi:hypothetical protein
MPEPRQVIMMGKKRWFDEERWQQLLTALAYMLHERRQLRAETPADGDPDTGAGTAP